VGSRRSEDELARVHRERGAESAEVFRLLHELLSYGDHQLGCDAQATYPGEQRTRGACWCGWYRTRARAVRELERRAAEAGR
jgi:hypothetical protein